MYSQGAPGIPCEFSGESKPVIYFDKRDPQEQKQTCWQSEILVVHFWWGVKENRLIYT